MNNRGYFILLCAFCLVLNGLVAAPVARDGPLQVFDQWQGRDSQYKGSPPFLLIRDMDEFIPFWKKHTPDDPMPYVDFTKTMLFLYAPGPNRFDMGPMNVVKYVRENGTYLLFLNYAKRRTGGFIRGPYLLAFLPPMPMNGQLYVFRVGDDKKGEPPRIPMYEFTHLGGGPISGMTMARLQAIQPKSMPIPYVTREPYVPEPDPQPVEKPVVRPTPAPQLQTPTPRPTQPPVAMTRPVVAAAAPVAPVARPVQTASVPTPKPTSAELPVIDAATAKSVDAFGMEKKAETPAVSTAEKAKSKPDLLSDPFQEQFNIEF